MLNGRFFQIEFSSTKVENINLKLTNRQKSSLAAAEKRKMMIMRNEKSVRPWSSLEKEFSCKLWRKNKTKTRICAGHHHHRRRRHRHKSWCLIDILAYQRVLYGQGRRCTRSGRWTDRRETDTERMSKEEGGRTERWKEQNEAGVERRIERENNKRLIQFQDATYLLPSLPKCCTQFDVITNELSETSVAHIRWCFK